MLAVGMLVDLLKVEQTCRLLLEVSKHTREDLGTVGRIPADGWVLPDGFQEVGVCVGCILTWEELIEFGLWKDLLDSLDIRGVGWRSRSDGFHKGVVQGARS